MIPYAAILGFILVQLIPLPKRKLLYACIAVCMSIVGLNVIAICYHIPASDGVDLFAGLAFGAGVGYFLKWIRSTLFRGDRVQSLTEPSQKQQHQPATSIAEKINQLGGHLANPATVEEIEMTENRLAVSLPVELKSFLLQHNGTTQESDQTMWSFWSCAEITSYSKYDKEEEFFCPLEIKNDQLTKLRGDQLILFADAMIHAPVYAVYLSPGEPCHETVFELISKTVSANSFKDWVDLFIARGEDAILIG